MEIKNLLNEKYGPRGGSCVESDDGYIEITVFETGMNPRFRLYFYNKEGKSTALPPANELALETLRPDGQKQLFAFKAEHDYLEATTELPEPHEFSVALLVNQLGHTQKYQTRFTEENHSHEDGHDHAEHGHAHNEHHHSKGILGWITSKFAHSHSIAEKTDTAMESHSLGIQTLKKTLMILGLAALFQLIIVVMSGSVALMADMIHNFADASTSLPLWLAFALAKRGSNRRFTYGYGKLEDVAGVLIVLIIFFSACLAAYESIMKLIHPIPMDHLVWVSVAAIIGFVGNEWVAIYRIRVGKKIGSAALIADGYHARVDGFTSLAVLIGVIGVLVGVPILDPLVGIGITLTILYIVKEAAKSVWIRLIDGIEPSILESIEHAPLHVAGVKAISDVRARWLGHRVHTDITIDVDPNISIREADELTQRVEHSLRNHIKLLGSASVRARPAK